MLWIISERCCGFGNPIFIPVKFCYSKGNFWNLKENLPKEEGKGWRKKCMCSAPLGLGLNPGPTASQARVSSSMPGWLFWEVSFSLAIDRLGLLCNHPARHVWGSSLVKFSEGGPGAWG